MEALDPPPAEGPDHWLDPAYRLDELGRAFVDATYRANHTTEARWLDSLGLHEARRRWLAGVMYVEIDGDRWMPTGRRYGRRLVTFPALDPWQVEADLVDLVAVDPERPDDWTTLYGRAIVLGKGLGLLFGFNRLEVRSDPLTWARGAGDGICLLNVTAARPLLVDRGLELIVDDLDTGIAIDRELQRWERLPTILVRGRLAA